MLPDPRFLTASAFLLSAHCPRRQWLSRHAPGLEEVPPSAPRAGLSQLLRTLYPGGVAAAEGAASPEEAVAATTAALEGGATLLYDAAFLHQDVLVTVDLLQQRRGRWYAYETKCAISVKPAHMQDAALQHWALAGAGLRLSGSYIVHLNKAYIRQAALDPSELLLQVPVTRAVRAMQPAVQSRVYHMKRLLAATEPPVAERGAHCRKPGPCGFTAHCPAETSLPDAPPPGSMEVDRAALERFLSGISYPLSFMDFEAVQPPVPGFAGHWPFRQVPFQYSLHRQDAPGAPLRHHAFLAEGTGDPARAFAEALLRDVGTEGPVLVYGQSFEHMILAQLATDFPDLEAPIYALKERLVDLGEPFLKKQVLLPALAGRSSLKAVLPELVPGLSYDGLAINDGGVANSTFARLRVATDPAEVAQMRADLLAYCAMDTLAMVHILERLRSLL